MKKMQGFTVIELLIVAAFLAVAGTFLIIQRNDLAAGYRDTQRKSAINNMYQNLWEVTYKQTGSYPDQLNKDTLPSVDPDIFNDPNKKAVGTKDSDYSYEPTNCVDHRCKGFTLTAHMEKEADYVKQSPKA